MDVGTPVTSGGPWISVQPDIYRTRFFQEGHDVYLGVGSGSQKQLCCITRSAEQGTHECLFIGSTGFIIKHVSHKHVLDAPAGHDPFLRLLQSGKPDLTWERATGPSLLALKAHILALEASLGPRRTISIGVVCGLPNQKSEEDVLATKSLSPLHLSFLSRLGEEIRAGSWN